MNFSCVAKVLLENIPKVGCAACVPTYELLDISWKCGGVGYAAPVTPEYSGYAGYETLPITAYV